MSLITLWTPPEIARWDLVFLRYQDSGVTPTETGPLCRPDNAQIHSLQDPGNQPHPGITPKIKRFLQIELLHPPPVRLTHIRSHQIFCSQRYLALRRPTRRRWSLIMATPCHSAQHPFSATQNNQVFTEHQACFQEDLRRTSRERPLLCEVSHNSAREVSHLLHHGGSLGMPTKDESLKTTGLQG